MAQASSTMVADATQQDPVRAVTDDEVTFFQDNGWAMLRGLVRPELCKELLEAGRSRLEGKPIPNVADFKSVEEQMKALSVVDNPDGTVAELKQWVEWRGPVRSAGNPDYCAVTLSKTIGRNVQRLLGRDKPTRLLNDIVVCKRADKGSDRTIWHQDSPNFSLDRPALSFWVALDEVTPDQGPVLFYSGSHHRGTLGIIAAESRYDLLDEYPELAELPLSPLHHMKPGDCTVHHGMTVHGAPTNTTQRPRWSYIITYFPGDALFNGAPSHACDGFGLQRGRPLDHPTFKLLPE